MGRKGSRGRRGVKRAQGKVAKPHGTRLELPKRLLLCTGGRAREQKGFRAQLPGGQPKGNGVSHSMRE